MVTIVQVCLGLGVSSGCETFYATGKVPSKPGHIGHCVSSSCETSSFIQNDELRAFCVSHLRGGIRYTETVRWKWWVLKQVV